MSHQRIDSIAEPAVDRAKAKIEALFSDGRLTPGVPPENYLRDMMLFDQKPTYSEVKSLDFDGDGNKDSDDPYIFNGEKRIDLDNADEDNNVNTGVDNAWQYQTDLDGDGTTETVAYSILIKSGIDNDCDGNIQRVDDNDKDDFPDSDPDDGVSGKQECKNKGRNVNKKDFGLWDSPNKKASKLITRTGPISIEPSKGPSSACDIPSLEAEQGWFAVNASSFRTNFQVNVFVKNQNEANKTVAALEYQQDRQLDQGNKFGVWFRYDLLIHPGPQFNLNGAIHSDGNLVAWNDSLRFYLVSSPESCIYSEGSSIIELTEINNPDTGETLYQSQAIATNGDTEEVDLFGSDGPSETEVDFKGSTDSAKNSGSFYDYTLDPLKLYTEDKLVSREMQKDNNKYDGDGSYDLDSARDSDWTDYKVSKRMINNTQLKPYVDDFYRADDRWGPKPTYGKGVDISIKDLSNGFDKNGQLIEDTAPSDLDTSLLTSETAPKGAPQEVGLDGYWERRAYDQGLRVIVGQRLELGNTFGWGSGGSDPLNPVENLSSKSFASGGNDRANEKRQLKTLRDNLAAVQATAVYHHNDDGDEGTGDFPVATLATTAHPGTNQTVQDSTTFDNDGVTGNVETNFLEGIGTNGWEFEVPEGSASNFETQINKTDSPLRKALTNLAYFAGDPDGAFPPTQEGSGGNIHPYPQLTMWGDYSNLRRVIDQLDNGTTYDELSLADKTTLHTASATLGMLAHHLDVEQTRYENLLDGTTGNLQNVGTQLSQLVDGVCSGGNPEIIDPSLYPQGGSQGNQGQGNQGQGGGGSCDPLFKDGDWEDPDPNSDQFYANHPDLYDDVPSSKQCSSDGPGFDIYCDEPAVYNSFTSEELLIAAGYDASKIEELRKVINTISQFEQVRRDRRNGFQIGAVPLPSGFPDNVPYDTSTGIAGPEQVGDSGDILFKPGCDPDIYSNVTAKGQGSGSNDRAKVGLAITLCRTGSTQPRYPSLYYLFPIAEHNYDGTALSSDVTNSDAPLVNQPTTEPYINAYVGTVNNGLFFQVVDETDTTDGYEDPNTEAGDSFSAIALQPRNRSEWKLPNTTTEPSAPSSDAAALTDAAINEIDDNGTPVFIPFLDKGMYNGRQQMAVRVLNIDLDLLRSNTINGESWLPNSGIVYAFREDAVREDGIARPNEASWSDCDTEQKLTNTSNNCYMDPAIERDPPKLSSNGVSPKPIDYIADPDRRPHGFRLSNGSKLGRAGTDNGLSFISDNPGYFLGDFNLHSKTEFTDSLKDNYSNFYDRKNLDPGFAQADADNPNDSSNDDWRPTEVLTDSLTFLSNSHCDGVIEDAIEGDNNGCASGTSSYRNTKLDDSGGGNTAGSSWDREGGSNSPIKVDRNGQLLFNGGSPYNNLLGTNSVQSLNNSEETTVNSVIVQGLSPTRENETYGGLHNFPRFNEEWNNDDDPDLNIAGSLVQLNFSLYDTANLDQQDTFKPASSATSGNHFPFYSPPNRKWGYDPALQYNPPGPIVKRLLSNTGVRSELYQEIELSDPYIQQLREAVNNSSP